MSTSRPAIDPEPDLDRTRSGCSPIKDPTGIVVIVPRAGDAAGIVTRMWTDERIVVKLIAEPHQPERIRLSFWALHQPGELERLCAALARQSMVRV